MAFGSGIGASFGVGQETTYGTAVVPTKWLDVNSVGLRRVKRIHQGRGVAAGSWGPKSNRRKVTGYHVEGSLSLEVTQYDMGPLLRQITGIDPTSTAYGGGLYTHDYVSPGDTYGKSLTVQLGLPETAGTVEPYTFAGVKVTSATFACEQDGALTLDCDLIGKSMTTATALTTPAIRAGLEPFTWDEATVLVAGASITEGIRGFSVTINRPMAVEERAYAGGAGLISEPIANDLVEVSGTITADFVDRAVFADRVDSDGSVTLKMLFNKSATSAFELDFGAVRFDTGTPEIGGPDIISGEFAFSGLWSESLFRSFRINYSTNEATV